MSHPSQPNLKAQVTSGVFWSGAGRRLILFGLAVRQIPHNLSVMLLGTCITLAGSVVSVRGIAARSGRDHRVVRLVCRVPGGAMICGLAEAPAPPENQ